MKGTAALVDTQTLAPIGAILLDKGLVSQKDLNQALAMQSEVGGRIGQALQRLGAVTEEALLETLSEQLMMPVADPLALPLDADALSRAAERLALPASFLLSRRAAVWFAPADEKAAAGGREILHVVAADPLSNELRERIETALVSAPEQVEEAGPILERRAAYYLGSQQTLDMCLAKLEREQGAGLDDDDSADAERLREMAEEAPVIDFVNGLFAMALKEKASDIHIEAFEHHFVVRLRIDGVLHSRVTQARSRFDAIASRIKLIAGMDIAERRLPQDGRHTIRFAGNEIDLRVSSVPSSWGESIVMRLLRKQTELPNLEGLGLTGRTGEVLNDVLQAPNGVFLVTGPTGSGKSTTLYRGLEKINDGYRKIITIEDPVEYDIEGITQIQVKADIGYDFASGLRAILRQDPDVIMVGEIRDGETATIAAQSALTGHLVLSTLHTNSALAAVTRLKDIGLEPFLISAAVRGLMAQRLVRALCDDCAVDETDREGEMLCRDLEKAGAPIKEALAAAPPKWRRAVGCDACDGTGYRGRLAVFEVVKIEEEMRDAISGGAPERVLLEIARRHGFLTLLEDGLLKAREGKTTLTEVHRVCGGDAH